MNRDLPSTGIEVLDRLMAEPALPAEAASVYETVLRGLLDGTAARPGFGTLHNILCERVAFTYARARMLEQMPGAYGPDVERSNRNILEFARTLIAEGKLADATDAAHQQIVRSVARAVLDVIDAADYLTDHQRLSLKEDLRASLTQQLDSLDVARRVLGGLPFAPGDA